jgi:hypothetical protein
MAKFQNDAMLDAALAYISSNATELYVCASQPVDRAGAISSSLIAAATPGFTGPANGDVSGRKLTVNEVADESITGTGTANHIALCSGSTLLYVTTCGSQALSSGGTVTVPAWDIEIADVTP